MKDAATGNGREISLHQHRLQAWDLSRGKLGSLCRLANAQQQNISYLRQPQAKLISKKIVTTETIGSNPQFQLFDPMFTQRVLGKLLFALRLDARELDSIRFQALFLLFILLLRG